VTRQEATELVRLLTLLEADPLVPETMLGHVAVTRGLALAALSFSQPDSFSRRVERGTLRLLAEVEGELVP
jgi:hypothetical protein